MAIGQEGGETQQRGKKRDSSICVIEEERGMGGERKKKDDPSVLKGKKGTFDVEKKEKDSLRVEGNQLVKGRRSTGGTGRRRERAIIWRKEHGSQRKKKKKGGEGRFILWEKGRQGHDQHLRKKNNSFKRETSPREKKGASTPQSRGNPDYKRAGEAGSVISN